MFKTEDPKPTLQEEFEKYHRKNPHIFQLFQKFALEALYSGRTRFGAKAIMERIRWETGVRGNGEEPRIRNSFTSRYARLLVARDSRFRDLFTMVPLKSGEFRDPDNSLLPDIRNRHVCSTTKDDLWEQ